jgi:hypothetical protein
MHDNNFGNEHNATTHKDGSDFKGSDTTGGLICQAEWPAA